MFAMICLDAILDSCGAMGLMEWPDAYLAMIEDLLCQLDHINNACWILEDYDWIKIGFIALNILECLV